MKTSKRVFGLVLTIAMLISAIPVQTAFAATSAQYAYSIGVNHASTDSVSGDFTANVHYAATCYGMMNNFTSFYQYAPSVEYLRAETNGNGVRKLASDVVFLNGHASPTAMGFGEAVGSGIYYGYDAYSGSGSNLIQYAGLRSIGSMSTVDLISFVGCATAGGNTNLPSVAVELGATTAVGFTESIISRFDDGPRWLQRYNDYLANGYSVRQAVNYASACYPDCTLSQYVKIYGSTTNTISSGLKRTAAPNLNITTVDIEVGKLENCIEVPVNECRFEGLENVIANLEEMSPDFDRNDYKVSVNMYSDEQDDGIITFKYFVGDRIATNKAYVISVEDGVAVNIIPSDANSSERGLANLTMSEEDLISAMEQFDYQLATGNLPEAATIDNDIPDGSSLVETRTGYHYDFQTDELTYTEENYYLTPGEMGVYVDDLAMWYVN